MPRGTVIYYHAQSGRGAIRDAESGRELTLDRHSFADPFVGRVLAKGQRVTFGIIREHHGERAIQVRVLP